METFAEYRLLGVLASGDMGTTYRAQGPEGSDPVALKILDKIDTTLEMKRGAAVEVLEFVMSIEHPRLHPLSRIIEAAEVGGRVALVMPLAPMRSLGDAIQAGKLPPPGQGLKLLAQVAAGLHFLHQQEIAHGSLKPNNILLDAEGGVTLTDLSMASLREMGFIPAQPTAQQLLFMPPEREYHAPPEIAGDVYSLAVLAYLLLTGKMPFDDPEPNARGVIPVLNLVPAAAAVLRRAMNPHLRLRYSTLGEFMTALKEGMQGRVDEQTERVFGVNAPPPPPAT
jgi:serine/threonine protein kinase